MKTARAALAGRRGQALLIVAALLLAVAVQGRIEAAAAGRPATHPLLYLPSGKYLRIASLGFDGLLADAIYLWSIQYYSNYAIADRYDYIEQIYDTVITELDPRYLDPYLVGSMIMDVEARRPEAALRLLDKGIARNPDKWILAFEAGFTCYNELHDYRRAASYFEQALRADDVHPVVRRLYANMHERAGDPRTSLREWAEIYDTSTDDYVRSVAWNHVHDLKVRVDLMDLDDGVARFRALRGRAPRDLGEIAGAGILPAIPLDPEENEYRYSARDGRVTYGGGLILARPATGG